MKLILSFILGMSFTAGVVYAGQARAGGMLVGGVVMGAVVTAAVVYKMREKVFPVRETHRIHRVVERAAAAPAAAPATATAVTTFPAPRPNVLATVEADAMSALVNFGMSKKEARGAVMGGYTEGMGFEELMRKCLERTGVGR